jgi:CpeT protein
MYKFFISNYKTNLPQNILIMNKILITLTLLIVSSSLYAQGKILTADVNILKDYMCGSFSSEAQAKKDTTYFDIRLHMKSIWPDRTDGYWIYIEQAVSKYMDKPYRQRVYHVYQLNDTTIVSQVYDLKNPQSNIGAWKNERPLTTLTTDSIEMKDGCAIYLKKNKKGQFVGSTPEKQCLSKLRGASYASSEVVISKKLLVSWDRGWDSNDKQVWGAELGGYKFVKKEAY